MNKIYDFNLAKNKYPTMTFEAFLKLFLDFENRDELDFKKVSVNVPLDFQSKFNDLVKNHVLAGHKIAIIGDYDVDGVCASAIMQKALQKVTSPENVKVFIPNRFKDGYGLNVRLVDEAINLGCKLIITVDNGIKANSAIEDAISKGLDVIVTDHHIPDMNNLPKATVIINPHIGNNHLHTHDICGAMVAFLLTRQMLGANGVFPECGEEVYNFRFLNELSELAAIATICDVMPLIYENRKIVAYLLNMMHRNEDANLGISKLMSILKTGRYEFNVESVSYGLGPCLNASGRLDSAYTSLSLLTENNIDELERLANELDKLNNDRKELTLTLKKEAMKQLDQTGVNVICLENASEGIIGIIAGKVCEDTGNPTFVFTKTEEGFFKGSGRSPKWCNLIEVASDVLKTMNSGVLGYGGHAGAMGLSLQDNSAVDLFKAGLVKRIATINKETEVQRAIRFPKEMSLEEVKTILDKFEPYGEGFEEPLFVCRTPINNISGMGESHCRFLGFLNGERTNFYYFFNYLDEYYEGKMVNCYFNIHKDVAETVGTHQYSCYVKFIEEV